MRRSTVLTTCLAVAVAIATGTATIALTGGRDDTPPAAAPAESTAPSLPTTLHQPLATDPQQLSGPSTAPSPVSSSATVAASSTSADTSSRHQVPVLDEDQARDPGAVADAFVQAVTGFDTATDVDRTGGAARGAHLMTDDLAFALTEADPFASTTQWAEWTAVGAWTSTRTYRTEIPWLPADSKTTAVRAIGYIVTIHFADGAAEDQPQQTLAVTMTRTATDQPWLVASTEVP